MSANCFDFFSYWPSATLLAHHRIRPLFVKCSKFVHELVLLFFCFMLTWFHVASISLHCWTNDKSSSKCVHVCIHKFPKSRYSVVVPNSLFSETAKSKLGSFRLGTRPDKVKSGVRDFFQPSKTLLRSSFLSDVNLSLSLFSIFNLIIASNWNSIERLSIWNTTECVNCNMGAHSSQGPIIYWDLTTVCSTQQTFLRK